MPAILMVGCWTRPWLWADRFDSTPQTQGISLPYECDPVASTITSKLTSKAQATIPQAVRTALGIGPGDEIAYGIEDGHVLLTKAVAPRPRRGVPFEDPFATFWEWDTPQDEEAFGDL